MNLGIRSKLFLVSVGLVALAVIATDAYLSTALDRLLTNRIRGDLFVRATLVEHKASTFPAPLDDRQGWDALADDLGRRAQARVSLIRKDGVVLGDSGLNMPGLLKVENHAGRPEVKDALAEGRGTSTRYSSTLEERMMYVALPFQREKTVAGVVRLAMPLGEVDRAIAGLHRIIGIASVLALGVAALLSSAASLWTSRKVRGLTGAAQRMAEGDLSVRTRAVGRDEIAELGRALDQLAASLSGTLEALEAERDLLGGVLAGMQEGVLLLSHEGRVVLVNPALREMLLLGPEVPGQSLLEAIRHAELKELLDRSRVSGLMGSAEIEIAGIKPRRLLVRSEVLSGDPGGVLAVFFDVTDIRRLESIRKEFVANVSHELRTPIAAIGSAAETLKEAVPGDPDAALRFVDIIERNAARLGSLVEDLLDLSRIESREFRLSSDPIEVAPIVMHVLSLCRERAEKKRIRLEADVPADLPLARADRRAMEQVLSNLVENAIKYCPEGTEVRIRAAADTDEVRIFVEDNGPGIEPRHLPRLFERFYRVDPGRSRQLGGTGLGLSIVMHLVEAMGGAVGVESVVGKGSTFSFKVPRTGA